jgi:hypothetical protein
MEQLIQHRSYAAPGVHIDQNSVLTIEVSDGPDIPGVFSIPLVDNFWLIVLPLPNSYPGWWRIPWNMVRMALVVYDASPHPRQNLFFGNLEQQDRGQSQDVLQSYGLRKRARITIQHKAFSRVSLHERLEDLLDQIVWNQLAFFHERGCPFSQFCATLNLSSQSFPKGKMFEPEMGCKQLGLGSFPTTWWPEDGNIHEEYLLSWRISTRSGLALFLPKTADSYALASGAPYSTQIPGLFNPCAQAHKHTRHAQLGEL